VQTLTKDEVCPLVTTSDQGTDETCDDHDLVDKHRPEDCGPGHSGGQHQVHQQQGCRDDPVDVANIVDGAVFAADDGVVAWELDADGCEAQVRAHGEVGNAGNKHDGGGDVVEDAVAAVLAGSKTEEGEASDAHGGADGEVEVRAMSGNGNLGMVRRMGGE
jgi:hypothetical protein